MEEIISKIDGVQIIKKDQIKDERGRIMHMMRNDDENFKKFGETRQAYVVLNEESKTRCFGFVQFYDAQVTTTVLEKSHVIDGKKIKCEKFTPRAKNTDKNVSSKPNNNDTL